MDLDRYPSLHRPALQRKTRARRRQVSLKGKIFLLLLLLLALGVGAVALFAPEREITDETTPDSSPTPDAEVEEEEPGGELSPAPDATGTHPILERRDYAVWEGPDEAVASWFSITCNREALQYGAQQYFPFGDVGNVPQEVQSLGYRRDSTELWGDRGAVRSLYTTSDGGRTFQEWVAVNENC